MSSSGRNSTAKPEADWAGRVLMCSCACWQKTQRPARLNVYDWVSAPMAGLGTDRPNQAPLTSQREPKKIATELEIGLIPRHLRKRGVIKPWGFVVKEPDSGA
jgi:hypothetical protein